MRVLIAGCGYVGATLATALAREGHEVVGVRRTSNADVKSAEPKLLVADITDPKQVSRIGHGYDWVVNCTAAGGGDETEYRSVYVRGNANLLEWFSGGNTPTKYVYTSSTSVYGQSDGSTVDENSPVEPTAATGRILVETEKLVLSEGRRRNVPVVILRLAGIYGPGRGYWFKQFVGGQARIEGAGERVFNMVHRDDVAGAIVAALQKARPGEVYNVADDEPVTQLAFFEWLAKSLDRPLPLCAEETESARKRGFSNKRVSNQKLKVELGYQFRFPTFREGYASEIARLTADQTRSTDAK